MNPAPMSFRMLLGAGDLRESGDHCKSKSRRPFGKNCIACEILAGTDFLARKALRKMLYADAVSGCHLERRAGLPQFADQWEKTDRSRLKPQSMERQSKLPARARDNSSAPVGPTQRGESQTATLRLS